MRIISLLAAVHVVALFAVINASCDIKDGFFDGKGGQKTAGDNTSNHKVEHRLRVSSIRYVSGAKHALTKESRSSKQEHEEINRTLKVFREFQRRFGSSNFKNNFILKHSESSPRRRRQVLRDDFGMNSTWNEGVFYTFNTSDQAVQNVFKMGAKVWRDNTCIDFMEDKYAKDKVVVVKQDVCISDVGRMGDDQILGLGEKATVGTAVHEIGHILGFFHTISRYDRDSYVRLLMENVNPDHIKDFGKISSDVSDVFGLTYDYGSVMHYGELSGSINNRPTIIAMDPYHQKTMGSDLISFSDIFMINEHYGCNVKCNKSTSAKCESKGFPHPRNCSICTCPGGYGGTLCDRRPSGCGEDLVATSGKQMVILSIGYGSGVRYQFEFCIFMITAPAGKKIEVGIPSISRGYEVGGCIVGGVEIKAQKDQKLTGYRFCSTNGTEGSIVSNSSRIPVILFNRFGTMRANFTFRYID